MNKPSTQQNRIILALSISLVGLCLLPSHWAKSISDPPRHVLSILVNPLTRPLHALGSSVRGRGEQQVEFSSKTSQLNALLHQAQARISNLQIRLDQAHTTIETLTRLKGYMRFDGASLIPARVTRSWADPAHPTLTLDKGQRDGLYPGQVVATGFNLVGRLTDVGHAHATVSLLMSPGRHVQVLILPKLGQTTEAPHGQVKVMAEVDKDGTSLTAIVPLDQKVSKGYLTRLLPSQGRNDTHAASSPWPHEAWGLLVGQVVSVKPLPEDPTSRSLVVIRPLQSPRHLTQVVVIRPIRQANRSSVTRNGERPRFQDTGAGKRSSEGMD